MFLVRVLPISITAEAAKRLRSRAPFCALVASARSSGLSRRRPDSAAIPRSWTPPLTAPREPIVEEALQHQTTTRRLRHAQPVNRRAPGQQALTVIVEALNPNMEMSVPLTDHQEAALTVVVGD